MRSVHFNSKLRTAERCACGHRLAPLSLRWADARTLLIAHQEAPLPAEGGALFSLLSADTTLPKATSAYLKATPTDYTPVSQTELCSLGDPLLSQLRVMTRFTRTGPNLAQGVLTTRPHVALVTEGFQPRQSVGREKLHLCPSHQRGDRQAPYRGLSHRLPVSSRAGAQSTGCLCDARPRCLQGCSG